VEPALDELAVEALVLEEVVAEGALGLEGVVGLGDEGAVAGAALQLVVEAGHPP
jgi:hypothetical protein